MSRVARRLTVAVLALHASAPAFAVDPDFVLHSDQFPVEPLQRLILGVDAGAQPIATLTREGYPHAAALLAGPTWDFSDAAGPPRALQAAPVEPGWSCYVPEAGLSIENPPCGFDLPGNDLLFLQDAVDSGARDVLAIDDDGSGTFWLSAWSLDEGGDPVGGDEELRLCFRAEDNRKAVPFIVFGNQDPVDPTRWFMAPGDPPWASEVFDCDGGIFADNVVVATQGAPCGSSGGTNAALTGDGGTEGRFRGAVGGIGTLTLPSGHVLDAVAVHVFASFEAKLVTFCLGADEITQQHQILWLVPEYGPIVQVRSRDDQGAELSAWTQVSSTVVGLGLLPPLSVSVDAVGSTTMTVSWDPGGTTDGIDGYEVHWGTRSGREEALPFTSGFLDAAAGTSWTISGLLPETEYFVSVASVRTYDDPRASVSTTYRSLMLPATIGADADGDGVRDHEYPPQASAVTDEPGAAFLGINRRVVLGPGGVAPPVADQFAPGCILPPLRSCVDETVERALAGLRLTGEAAASGTSGLWLYQHSDPVSTLRLGRDGGDLVFGVD